MASEAENAENTRTTFHRRARGERRELLFTAENAENAEFFWGEQLARLRPRSPGYFNPKKIGRAIEVGCGRDALRVLRVLRGKLMFSAFSAVKKVLSVFSAASS